MHALELITALKLYLRGADIEGLIASGCPLDEYDTEAAEIADLATSSLVTPPMMEEEVLNYWNKRFGPFGQDEFVLRVLL